MFREFADTLCSYTLCFRLLQQSILIVDALVLVSTVTLPVTVFTRGCIDGIDIEGKVLTDREQGEADSEAESPGHHGTPQP